MKKLFIFACLFGTWAGVSLADTPGSGLTPLNLPGQSVTDGQLPTDVALLNSTQTFTGSNTFQNLITGTTIALTQNGASKNFFPSAPVVQTGNTNTFFQNVIQNLSAGANASSDYVATSNLGADTSNYINLGINSSGFSNASQTITPASWGYLYTSDSGLAIGSNSNGSAPGGDTVFFTSSPVTGNERLRITTAGGIIATSSITVNNAVAFNGSVQSTTTFTGAIVAVSSVTAYGSIAIPKQGNNGEVLYNSTGTVAASSWLNLSASSATIHGPYTLVASSQCLVTVSSATTTTTFARSNLTCTVNVPTDSTCMVKISAQGTLLDAAVLTASGYASIFRGTTNLATSTNGFFRTNFAGTGATSIDEAVTMVYQDTASGTGAVSYSVYIKNDGGSVSVAWNDGNQNSFMLLEVFCN